MTEEYSGVEEMIEQCKLASLYEGKTRPGIEQKPRKRGKNAHYPRCRREQFRYELWQWYHAPRSTFNQLTPSLGSYSSVATFSHCGGSQGKHKKTRGVVVSGWLLLGLNEESQTKGSVEVSGYDIRLGYAQAGIGRFPVSNDLELWFDLATV